MELVPLAAVEDARVDKLAAFRLSCLGKGTMLDGPLEVILTTSSSEIQESVMQWPNETVRSRQPYERLFRDKLLGYLESTIGRARPQHLWWTAASNWAPEARSFEFSTFWTSPYEKTF
jgi:hypothetical protein